jgi:uracil phosphoribosyltransferase
MTLHVIDHPALHDIVARLRNRSTSSDGYRALTYRVSTFLIPESTRDLPTREEEIETPPEDTILRRLGSRVVAVPVLRAGIGMLQAFVDLVPGTEVGNFGDRLYGT